MKAILVSVGVLVACGLVGAPAADAKSKVVAPATAIAKGNEKLWMSGYKMVDKGNGLIADGEKDLVKAEEQRRKASNKITEGKAKAASAEEAYRKYLAGLTAASDPQGAKAQVESLDDLAKRWDDAVDQVADGEKGVREADKRKADGERKKAEGARLISDGNALKGQAEGLLPAVATSPPATPALAPAPAS